MNRRTFVQHTGMAVLASGISAQSYGRILGANDRIRLGITAPAGVPILREELLAAGKVVQKKETVLETAGVP